MILIKENPNPKKFIIDGEEIMAGPRHIMKVTCLRKEFKVWVHEDGTYYCEDQMTFKQILALNPFELPKKLTITFKYDGKMSEVYTLYSVSKKNDFIQCKYSLWAEAALGVRSFKWSPMAYYYALKKEINGSDIGIEEYGISPFDPSNFAIELEISSPIFSKVSDCIAYTNARLDKIHTTVQIALGNVRWRKKYERDEKAFCREILEPLFRKMGFRSIVYNHGAREFGKDFTFSEFDKFDQIRHYGVQVKAGNVSGEINSKLDEIIGQIEDAFKMPYFNLNPKSPNYVTTVLVIISGRFTENAKEKIRHKLDNRFCGSVYFMDKQEILELIEKYWTQ
jgi:hypothetical protein